VRFCRRATPNFLMDMGTYEKDRGPNGACKVSAAVEGRAPVKNPTETHRKMSTKPGDAARD